MKTSHLKRLLSTLCVFALIVSLLGTSVLAAPIRSSGADDHTTVEHTHEVADAPAVNAPASTGRTPVRADALTGDEGLTAELMAAKMVYNVTTDGTEGNSQFTFTSVKAQGSPSTLTYDGLTLNKAIKMESATSISFTAAETGKLVIVVDGADGKSIKVDGTKYTVASNVVTVDSLGAGTHTITKGDVMNLYYISFGSDCDHAWEETGRTAATCTVNGSVSYECSKCHATKSETLLAPGHDWANGAVTATTPSTCQVAGSQTVKCANCTETKVEPLPLADHTDTDGDHICDVCNKCDHNYKGSETKAATCTEDGEMTYECQYCHDKYTDVIEALGHDWQADGTCSRCDAVKNTSFIAAAGDLESAYALWPIDKSVSKYTAYVKEVGGTYTQLDDQLIRQYPGYMRVDALGLVGGKSYVIKVEDNKGKAMETETLPVTAHDRSGFGFVNGSASGAYNDDGTLKSNAEVLYVTKASDISGYIKDEVWNNKDNKSKSTPVCVRVIGHVTMSGAMGFQDWKTGLTVEGVGNDALLTGGGVFVKGCSNVEVRNLGVMHVQKSGKNDLIAVEQTNDHVWVHNNDLFYGFAGSGDQAKGDGSLDVKDAEYCSFSYNHFWDSGKCSLLGNGSSENYITYHHNWFDHSDSRHPRTRGGDKGGNFHVYNNYYDGVSKYGVGTTSGSGTSRASVFIEANYFRNTKYPIMNSKQASDSNGSGGSNTFSGDNPGFNKVWNNVMVGSKNFVSQMDDPNSFDGYVVSSRDEKVPDSVSAGGSKYNNFDTTTDINAKNVQDPKDAVTTVTKWAGRVQGGDIQYVFDDATEDSNYAVIDALNNILNSYETELVSVGGTVTASATTTEHTHRPGTWITTKAPGCDPNTKKLVNGTETQYCLDCGEVLNTRSVDGAHSNDGSGVCQVCGEGVANGGGPVVNANSKILKGSDFSALAKDTVITQDMLNEKYAGYFQVTGSVKAGMSSTKTGAKVDHLALPNTGNGGITFTIKNGPADVYAKVSSTGSTKTSTAVLKDASGNPVAAADPAGQSEILLEKINVSDARTVKYSLPAGTYTVYSVAGTNGVRLVQLTVTEAEVACEHATTTHTDAVAATCTTEGNIEYWTCSECNKTFSDAACTKEVTDVTTEELGHNMTRKIADAVAATCTTDGKTAEMGCTRCDYTEGGDTIEALGHDEATRTENNTGATCTTAGSYDLVTYCKRCNTVLKTEHKTDVLAPHDLTKTEAVAATCVAGGNIAYWTCSACHKTFSDAAGATEVTKVTTEKDPTNHVGGTEIRNAKDPTTTEEGYTGDVCCKSCDAVITAGTKIEKLPAGGGMSKLLKGSDQDASADIKALKDSGTNVSANSPAWGAGKAFKMGGNDTVKDFFTVHYSAKSKVDTTEKTWDFEGNYYTTGVATKESRFNFGSKAQPSKNLENTIEFTTTKPATVKIWWVQAGGEDTKDPSKSSAIRNIALWDSAKAQKWTSASTAVEKNTAEFDQVNDLPAGTYYLGAVDTNYFFMVEVIEEGDTARTWNKPTTPVDPDPPTPGCTHANKTHTDAVAATCTVDGNIEYWTCSDCNKMFSDEACTTEVTKVTTDKLGHDMTRKVADAVAATCTTAGKTAVVGCTRCDHTEGGDTINALGHTEATRTENNTGATCTTPGSYDLVTYCTVCNTVIKTEHKSGVTLPHTEATREENKVEATCTTAGSYDKVTYCSVCNTVLKTDKVITDALGHDWQADGTCSRCDAKKDQETVAVTGVSVKATESVKVGNAVSLTATVAPENATNKSVTWSSDNERVATVNSNGVVTGVSAGTAKITVKTVDGDFTAVCTVTVSSSSSGGNGGGGSHGGGGGGGGGSTGGGSSKPTEDLSDTKTPLAGGPELNSKDHTAYITGYTDGTVGAERNITRQETAVIFYRLLTEQSKAVYGTSANDFSDVADDHWAVKEISTLAKAGIVKGLPDGGFGPERNITRAEFVTMAVRFFTVNTTGTNPFTDVNGHWAEKEILFAANKGWVNGLPDGSFGPDKLITRAEAMRIINNILDRKADATSVVEGTVSFSDVSADAWYYYDVVEATNGHTYDRQATGSTLEKWTALTK